MNYFPIIRGKQFDLAAITELLTRQHLPTTVTPILEPVKDIPGITKATRAFSRAQHAAYVIQNPQVGTYRLLATPRHLPDVSGTVQQARIFDAQPAPLIIATTAAQAKLLPRRQLALVPDEARVRQLALPHAVYLNDHFTVYPHTSDYGLLQDEFYQYPPLMLPGIGFADYPLATADYFEHGYPQRALAIHLVYPAADGSLRLHHFVSVNNDDFTNPQAKFFEILVQLAAWLPHHPDAQTLGTKALMAAAAQHHFPGLGVVRKFQLMHHLEMIGRWLASTATT